MSYSKKTERILFQLDDYIPNDLTTVEKGSKFLEWVLLNVFDKTESELDDDDIESESGVLITDGSGDKGIDAAFVFKGALHIIQCKYRSSHSEDSVHAYIAKMTNLLNGVESSSSDRISRVCDLIFDEDTYSISDIQFFYITDNSINVGMFNNEIQKFDDEMPELCGKSCRMRIMGIDQIVDYQDELINAIPSKYQGTKTELMIEKHFENKEKTTIVAEVAIKNLAMFVKKNKEYLFYSNIRNFLGKSGRINRKMVETFHKYPKDFWYFNNGITIVCDNYKPKNEFQLEIITPQIVNGCQTVNVIYTQWDSLKKKKDVQNSKEGTILVKIIRDTKNKRAEITRYTNSQNAVSGKDFFALESFHKDLKKEFENLGYNYEIQRNAEILKSSRTKIKGNNKYDYLFDKTFNKKHTLVAKEAVQAYVSGILLFPAKAKSIGDFVPGGQYYDATFNEKTPIDPLFYLFPYAIMYYGNNILNHKKDNRQKASNLLFVSVYFRLINKILIKLNIIQDNIDNIAEISGYIEILDKLFTSQEINKKLIVLADEILIDQIFDDTTVIEMIGDNFPRFLKTTIESEKCVKIINDKIDNRLNKASAQVIIEGVKNSLYL